MMSIGSESASHSAHLGGAVAGLCVGCVICKNLTEEGHEKLVKVLAACIGFLLTAFSLAWLFLQDGGPRNLWDAYEERPGWCWYRQIFDMRIDKRNWFCVRCGTKSCIAEWETRRHVDFVMLSQCKESGWC